MSQCAIRFGKVRKKRSNVFFDQIEAYLQLEYKKIELIRKKFLSDKKKFLRAFWFRSEKFFILALFFHIFRVKWGRGSP